jgi:hypothetical protein
MMKQDSPVPPAPAARQAEDLSAEIIRSVEKLPADRVTCLRVSGNHYRCNWWSASSTAAYDNPQMHGLLVTTHRVRKSQFLNVTRGEGGLLIRELPVRFIP